MKEKVIELRLPLAEVEESLGATEFVRASRNLIVSGCIIFTIYMLFACIVGLIFAGPEQGIIMSITMLVAAFVLAGLRRLWFTDKVIRKLAYSLRIFGFGVTAFVVLAACAYLGDWLPMDVPGAWMSFTVIYLVVFIVICAARENRITTVP